MSDHSALFEETGLAAMFATHADAGRFVYCAEGGLEIACDAIIGAERIDEGADKSDRHARRVRQVTIQTASVEAPRENATARVDGVEYGIVAVEISGDGFAELTLARTPTIETARPNYRTQTQVPRYSRRG